MLDQLTEGDKLAIMLVSGSIMMFAAKQFVMSLVKR